MIEDFNSLKAYELLLLLMHAWGMAIHTLRFDSMTKDCESMVHSYRKVLMKHGA
jgi:hypothetical protein